MSKFKSYHEYSSRLARQEAKKYTHQALIYTLSVIGLIALVLFVGIPAITKGAIFLGNIRSANNPIAGPNTIPPAPPQLIPPPEATSSAQISLEGYADSNTTVSIYVNGMKQAESLVDGSGRFNFNDIPLGDGRNELYAQSRNSENLESQPSTLTVITVFNEKPELSITKPGNGDKIYGYNNRQTAVEGLTDSHNTVFINDRQVFVSTTGTFKQTYELKEGENEFVVKATDPAGNSTQENIKVSYYP